MPALDDGVQTHDGVDVRLVVSRMLDIQRLCASDRDLSLHRSLELNVDGLLLPLYRAEEIVLDPRKYGMPPPGDFTGEPRRIASSAQVTELDPFFVRFAIPTTVAESQAFLNLFFGRGAALHSALEVRELGIVQRTLRAWLTDGEACIQASRSLCQSYPHTYCGSQASAKIPIPIFTRF